MEKIPQQPVSIPRRTFMRNGVALVGTAAFPVAYMLAPDRKAQPSDPETPEDTTSEEVIEDEQYADTEEPAEESIERSDSQWFKNQVQSFMPEFTKDLPVLLERQEVVDTIKEKFVLTGIDRPKLRQSLESLFVGIAIVESRLDEVEPNDIGAFKWLQLMPGTWDDLAKAWESKESLKDNIAVAVRLIEQEYQHISQMCGPALALIQKNYFNDDPDAFDAFFFTPILANAYNAGMGTLHKLVNWFAEKFPTPESTIDALAQSEVMTQFDVFYLLTNKGYSAHLEADAPMNEDTPPAPKYRIDSSTYTAKVYAAWWVFNEA